MNLFCFFSKPFWINFNGVVWRVGLSSNSNLHTLSSLNSHIFLYYHSELVNKKVTKGCSCKPTSNKGQINSRSTFIVRLDPCLRLCVWEFCFFSSSFFFFFFSSSYERWLVLFIHVITLCGDKVTVHTLFMRLTTILFRKKILKIDLTVLFTYLKIILLQYFSFQFQQK